MTFNNAVVYFLIACSVVLPVVGIAAVVKALRRNKQRSISRMTPIEIDESSRP